jgi:hypothetical protein
MHEIFKDATPCTIYVPYVPEHGENVIPIYLGALFHPVLNDSYSITNENLEALEQALEGIEIFLTQRGIIGVRWRPKGGEPDRWPMVLNCAIMKTCSTRCAIVRCDLTELAKLLN